MERNSETLRPAVTTSMGIFFKIGNSLENENVSYNLLLPRSPKKSSLQLPVGAEPLLGNSAFVRI